MALMFTLNKTAVKSKRCAGYYDAGFEKTIISCVMG